MRDNFARENDWPNDLKYRAIFRTRDYKTRKVHRIKSHRESFLSSLLFYSSPSPILPKHSRPFRDLFSQGRPSLSSPSVRPPHNRTSIERQWKVDVQFSMFSKDSSLFPPQGEHAFKDVGVWPGLNRRNIDSGCA